MKRIIAIFIVLLVAAGPVFSQKKDSYRVRTVVIDPGHGGAKPGAQGKRTQEKAITLAVAKKFGKELVKAGATVVVIEHDLDVVRNSDYIIDMGPGGGEAGGRIVACGTPEEIAAAKGSVTGKYLRGQR